MQDVNFFCTHGFMENLFEVVKFSVVLINKLREHLKTF